MARLNDPAVAQARNAVLASFRWLDGHADVWQVFRQADALGSTVRGLAAPFVGRGVTAVIGVEARGFLLGAAVAVQLGVGFVAVRKAGALFPGATVSRTTDVVDYRGNRHELLLQPDCLRPTDRVLLVDDWIETGGQARAVAEMVAECGATMVGISVMVDELDPDARTRLPTVHALLATDHLPNDGGSP